MRKLIVILWMFFSYCTAILGQDIRISEASYCVMEQEHEIRKIQSSCYTIHNNDTSRMVLFFIEDDNTTMSHSDILKRKVFRRYGDFSLSMLECDPNIIIEDTCYIVPELFVKILNPCESFNIIVEQKTSQAKSFIKEIPKHLLICKETDFKDSQIGLCRFLSSLKEWNFDYPYSYIVIDVDVLHSFVQNK